METATAPAAKSSQSPSSRQIAAGSADIADLLSAIDNGVRVTGMILAATAPELREGTSDKGRAYKFWNQKLQVWTGDKAVECTITKDNENEFAPVSIGTKASFRVGRI